MTRIRVTIDRLILHGMEPADAKVMAETLESQLSEQLADGKGREQWARPHRTPVLKLGRLPMEAGAAGARKLGRQVAGAVRRGLKP